MHNQRPSWLKSFQQGKRIMFGGMSNHTKAPTVDLGPDGKLTAARESIRFSSRLFADAAMEFLHNYKDEKPFYAYVAFTAPHDPAQSAAEVPPHVLPAASAAAAELRSAAPVRQRPHERAGTKVWGPGRARRKSSAISLPNTTA